MVRFYGILWFVEPIAFTVYPSFRHGKPGHRHAQDAKERFNGACLSDMKRQQESHTKLYPASWSRLSDMVSKYRVEMISVYP